MVCSRFEEAEQEILTAVKLLATRAGLIEAVKSRAAEALWTISLTGRGALDLDYITRTVTLFNIINRSLSIFGGKNV